MTLLVAGEIDLANCDVFALALRNLVDDAQQHAVVDLRRVTFMDSAGLHALLTGRGHAAQANQGWSVRPSETVRRLFEISGLSDQLGAIPPDAQ